MSKCIYYVITLVNCGKGRRVTRRQKVTDIDEDSTTEDNTQGMHK